MTSLTKIMKSKWVVVVLIVLITHYLTLLYYTIKPTNHQAVLSTTSLDHPTTFKPARPAIFPNNPEILKRSRAVSFPVNPYFQKKQVITKIPPKEATPPKKATPPTIKPVKAAVPAKAIQSDNPAENIHYTVNVLPSNQASFNKTRTKRLILAWTSLTNKKPLWGIKPYSFSPCVFKNCEITSDRSRLREADLLIFRIRQLKAHRSGNSYRPFVQYLDYNDMPQERLPMQMWMDINQESPVYTHADHEIAPLNDVFNISANYLLSSDFTLSYIPIVKKKIKPATVQIDYSRGKTKMALWYVSHCNAASGRDKYVAELQKHNISVDIFGKCTGKSDGCSAANISCYKEVRSRYKFYLAFENSICNEYITEKFWNTLSSDSYNIPIALGASIQEYKQFAPPNSYIHTRNFTTVKALADFMHKINADDQAFNSYHRWRETHVIEPRNNGESLHCYMCRQANKKMDGNSKYKKLSTYWSRLHSCEVQVEPVK